MASNPTTVAYLVEQMGGAGVVSARKMFGEYGLYRGGKMVALVCGDQLFVKPTAAGRRHAADSVEASPYKGSKPCLLIPVERWDDREWLSRLAELSATELPNPTPKRSTKRG